MGARGHGTYAKLWRDVWTHRKTYRLARELVALGVPQRWSVAVAVGQLHQLLCWCIAEQDDGQVAHLPSDAFARIVGWDDPRKSDDLFAAWKVSGFLDCFTEDDVRVHDLAEAAGELLRKREERRTKSGQRPPDGTPAGRHRDATGTPPAPHDPPDGTPAASLARAFGSGSGSGSGSGRLSFGENPPLPPISDPPISLEPEPRAPEPPPPDPDPPNPEAAPHDCRPTIAVRKSSIRQSSDRGPAPPVDELVAAYRRILPTLPQPRLPLAAGVRVAIGVALKREPLDAWERRFERVTDCPWLMGETRPDWTADLLWLLGPKNAAKIDSGAYDRRAGSGAAAVSPFERARAEAFARNPELWDRDLTDDFGQPVRFADDARPLESGPRNGVVA